MNDLGAVDAAYRRAAECRVCFEQRPAIGTGVIDVAQPRWVGQSYWRASPRILFVLVNPGSGESDDVRYNRQATRLLHDYRDGRTNLATVLEHQREYMAAWGQGRFQPFYIDALGLNLNDVAFLNVALCSVAKNAYHKSMLARCFNNHTSTLIQSLKARLILLSGGDLKPFRDAIQRQNPRAEVDKMLHYAHYRHRRLMETEALDYRRIRATIERLKLSPPTV